MADETLSIAITVEDGQLQAAVVRGNRALQTFNSTLRQTAVAAGTVSRANDELAASSERSAAGFATQQFALGLLSSALARFAAQAPAAFLEFEQASLQFQRTVVSASAGAGVGFNAIVEDFREISQEIPVTTNELIQLSGVLGQLGVIPQETRDSLQAGGEAAEQAAAQVSALSKTVAEFSAAADLSSEEAARAFGRIQAIFFSDLIPDKQIERTTDLANVLNELGNNFAANAGQIQDFVQRVGASASNLGFAAEEVAALGAATSQFGVTSQVAATALQRFFGLALTRAEELSEVTGQTAAEFRAAFEREPATALTDFLRDLNELSTQRRAEVFASIGAEQRLVTVLSGLAANTEQYTRALALANAEETGDSISRELAVRNATLSASFQTLANTITNQFVAAFQALEPVVVTVVNAVQGFVEFLGPVAPVLITVATAVAGLGAVLTAGVFIFNQWSLALGALRQSAASGQGPLGLLGTSFQTQAAQADQATAANTRYAASTRAAGAAAAASASGVQTFGNALTVAGRAQLPASIGRDSGFAQVGAAATDAGQRVSRFSQRFPTFARGLGVFRSAIGGVASAIGGLASGFRTLVAGAAPLIPIFLALEAINLGSKIGTFNDEFEELSDNVSQLARVEEELNNVGFFENALSRLRIFRGETRSYRGELEEIKAELEEQIRLRTEENTAIIEGSRLRALDRRNEQTQAELARATTDQERERLQAIIDRREASAESLRIQQNLAIALRDQGVAEEDLRDRIEAILITRQGVQRELDEQNITQAEALRLLDRIGARQSDLGADARAYAAELREASEAAKLLARELDNAARSAAAVRPFEVGGLVDEAGRLGDIVADINQDSQAVFNTSFQDAEGNLDRLVEKLGETRDAILERREGITTEIRGLFAQLENELGKEFEGDIFTDFIQEFEDEQGNTQLRLAVDIEDDAVRQKLDDLVNELNDTDRAQLEFSIAEDDLERNVRDIAETVQEALSGLGGNDLTQQFEIVDNALVRLQSQLDDAADAGDFDRQAELIEEIAAKEELRVRILQGIAFAQNDIVEVKALEEQVTEGLAAQSESLAENEKARAEAAREAAETRRREQDAVRRELESSNRATAELLGTNNDLSNTLSDILEKMRGVAETTSNAAEQAQLLAAFYAEAQAAIGAAATASLDAFAQERRLQADALEAQNTRQEQVDADRARRELDIQQQRARATTEQERREVAAAEAALAVEDARNAAREAATRTVIDRDTGRQTEVQEVEGQLTRDERRGIAAAEFEQRRAELEADRSLTENQRRQALQEFAQELRLEEQLTQEKINNQQAEADNERRNQREIANEAQRILDEQGDNISEQQRAELEGRRDAANARAEEIRAAQEAAGAEFTDRRGAAGEAVRDVDQEAEDLFLEEDEEAQTAREAEEEITAAKQATLDAQNALNEAVQEYIELLREAANVENEGEGEGGRPDIDTSGGTQDINFDPGPDEDDGPEDTPPEEEAPSTDPITTAGDSVAAAIEATASALEGVAASIESSTSSIESAGQSVTSATASISSSVATFASRVNNFASGLSSSLSTLSSAAGSISSAISGIGSRLSAIESQLASIASS